MSRIAQDLFTPDELAVATRVLEGASLLPARIYTDRRIYDLEAEQVFMRNWLPICRVSDVAEPGSYFTRTIMREPILITRDRDGALHALSNVCRHRNRIIAQGAGKCATGRLTCPYHAWTYGLDGQLLSAPQMDRSIDYDVSKIALPRLGLDIWQGFIFINFDATAPRLSPQLKTLDAALAPYKLDQADRFDLISVKAEWNWKVSMENFSEAYHQPTIHSALDVEIPATLVNYEDADGPYSLFSMYKADGGEFPTVAGPFDGLSEEFRKKVTVVNVYPLLHLLIDPGAALWLDWNITGPEQHEMIWHVLTPKGRLKPENVERFKADLLSFQGLIVEQDVGACTGVALGVRSRFTGQGRMSWMEKAVHQFHQFLAREYQRP